MSAGVSGIINLSWIETGTRNIIRKRNLSMAKKARNNISKAGGISQRGVAPVLINIVETIRKIMLRTNAPIVEMLFLITIRYFDLFLIPHNRV